MDTVIKKIMHDDSDDEIYEQAAEILKNGGLVAFPTETVYGLGADALDEKASAKIYAAKGRPSDNPLIVHIADKKDLEVLSCDVNDMAVKAAEAFWPGPLTMILKKKDIVPDSITGGLGTVAIRMPSHPVAARLIKTSGVYIAAPSANISGKPSPTKAEHVIHDMNGRINMIIADDTVDIGVESTIVDLSEDVPTILRPGFITKKQLEDVLGEVKVDPAVMGNVADGIVPKAPGMKYKHYAPECDVVIADGGNDCKKTASIACREYTRAELSGKKCIILATEQTKSRYSGKRHVVIGDRTQPQTLCAALFRELRNESRGMDLIIAESVPAEAQGLAYMNRLLRAAGFTVISE